MADYSDSDDGGDLEYTTTSVLLGYAEPESADDSISHLGGTPTWLDESSPMDSRLAKCLSCNNLMPLLLQLDGNLPDSPQHTRMLYLFGCRAKGCRKKPGSIRAIRGVKSTGLPRKSAETEKPQPSKETVPESAAPEQPKSNMGDLIFGSSSSNPFSSSSNTNPFATTASVNPFATTSQPKQADTTVANLTKTFASVASISTTSSDSQKPAPKPTAPPENQLIGPPSPWPETSKLPQYPPYYLDASYEELEPDTLTLQAQKLAKTIKMDTGEDDMDLDTPSSSKKASQAADKESASSSKKDSKLETFESAMNTAFLHFQTITGQNPEQVLRYERKGTPLLYSKDDFIGKLLASPAGNEVSMAKVPACTNCQRKRTFELQLMPHAITMLEKDESGGALDEGMVWGTILVGTCFEDCDVDGSDKGGGYLEEWVGIQWETD